MIGKSPLGITALGMGGVDAIPNHWMMRASAHLHMTASAALSIVKVFTPVQAQARLRLIAHGLLRSVKPLQAKAKLRLIARQGAGNSKPRNWFAVSGAELGPPKVRLAD